MKNDFTSLSSKSELAEFLDITVKQLDYNAYNVDEKYNTFTIPKKRGGTREIFAPIPSLKSIQKKLAKEIYVLYNPKRHVHSYIKKKGIRTNAKIHIKQYYVLNIDLQDFFPSINFGRVSGMFKSHPFNFNDEISYLLAQICCHKNFLPQGSPTSPIISNFICRSLDNQLKSLAKTSKCYYTRYADDITFSTRMRSFPSELASYSSGTLELGKELIQIIEDNGFTVNSNKNCLRRNHEHQFVTGLTVNEKLNVKRRFIKQLRAMLYAWEKHGLDKAALEHFKKYSRRHKDKEDNALFIKIIEGKLHFLADIRGKDDDIFKKYVGQFKKLSPVPIMSQYIGYQGDKILVYTEGNTDWMHLKNALNRFNANYDYEAISSSIKIHEYDENHTIGDTILKNLLHGYLVSGNPQAIIGIFDSDNLSSIGEFSPVQGKRYQKFDDRVYTFFLPKPPHRRTKKNCIEHYYKDVDLKIEDENGRRIYLSDEFDNQSGELKAGGGITCYQNARKLGLIEGIIDSQVRDSEERSLALSKKAFAANILNKHENYKKVDITYFRLIFDTIHEILQDIESNVKKAKAS